MALPGIHACSRLTEENEMLVKKLKKLKKKNDSLEKELREINERLRFENFVKEHTLMLSTGVQTDIPGYKPWVMKKAAPKPLPADDLRNDQRKQIDSLLKINKSLMKKYQKELKKNAEHLETIAALNLRIQELEGQLNQLKHKISSLQERHNNSLQQRSMTPKVRRRKRSSSLALNNSLDLRSEMEHLRQERDDLKKEKKRLRRELGALDDGFFEEIEDIKYALQQSAILNKQYESTLQNVCSQFGIDVPTVTVKSPSKRHLNRPRTQ